MSQSQKVPILKLSPFVVSKLWGGERLKSLKSLKGFDHAPIGETWEVSRLGEGASQYQGRGLDQLLEESQLPYLIKLIETTDNLSIQAHPDDAYARRVENSLGKTECWFVLEAQPGAGIYLGLKPGVGKIEFLRALNANEDMSRFLTFYPVKPGDFFYVPAGTIHAIGKGVFLTEIQQSCGITYRVWDWNRVDDQGNPRELHVEKAMDIIRFEEDFNSADNFRIKNVWDKEQNSLVEHPQFKVTYSTQSKKGRVSEERVAAILVLSGEVELDVAGKRERFCAYESGIIREGSLYQLTVKEPGQYIWVE